ncbi:Dps family protein [Peptostreptococcus canis]|uniref:DNA starvation/stationary phase protection protein n=1 Tax=Peptostreptococcus canis TaxID=1159213 RepID=A0ABR6TLX5_9FIRM|nr:DNA starvation/stationary phase protection protein [Peptostreptococcus canis]MBC2576427.1 DNA starvation/stationary phase protection protein [Peptostreptococcus canis]MBP1998402.1 starvation-inducible DNA-binding protein [Peptostreptococcus canis]
MKNIELRKEYLANLMVLNVKLHNLHWNIVGKDFVAIHEFTEKLYNAFFEKFDEVAEMFKIEGIYPPASLKEYLEISSIEELPSNIDFSGDEVLNIIKNDLEKMNKLAYSIREIADEEDNFSLVGSMEGDIESYSKELWFLQSMIK